MTLERIWLLSITFIPLSLLLTHPIPRHFDRRDLCLTTLSCSPVLCWTKVEKSKSSSGNGTSWNYPVTTPFRWIEFRWRFEISPLLSNIVLNYPTASFCTNPIGRNDVYGKRHIREPSEPSETWATWATQSTYASCFKTLEIVSQFSHWQEKILAL